MVTFTWKIETMERDAVTNVVQTIHYSCTASEDGHSFSAPGKITLPDIDPQDPNFIPWDEITHDQAIQWLMAVMEDPQYRVSGPPPRELEEILAGQLHAYLHPKTRVGTPW